jgi:hypothetical protein
MASVRVRNKFLKEKLKSGKSIFQNRATKQSTIVSNFQPPINLQEVFRSMLKKHPELGFENIDEFRKIFFTYYLFHKQMIQDGALVSIDLPYLGRIIPGEKAVKKQMTLIASGLILKKETDFVNRKKFFNYMYLLYKIDREKIVFLNKKGIVNNEQFDESIRKDYQKWFESFKKRRVHIGEYDDWKRSGDRKGFLI